MTLSDQASLAFARQAKADLDAFHLYEEFPQAMAAACHRLLFLQMACEKLVKAHLVFETNFSELPRSHAVVARHLPGILRQHLVQRERKSSVVRDVMKAFKQLAGEIEQLNPAVERAGKRPDNCEYPWEANGAIHSPLDWTFAPSDLWVRRNGRLFLNMLRAAIDEFLR